MSDRPKKIEHYEKRFGLIAIERAYITPEQLVGALAIQIQEDVERGTHRLIGEILMDQDKMTPGQIDDVVRVLLRLKS